MKLNLHYFMKSLIHSISKTLLTFHGFEILLNLKRNYLFFVFFHFDFVSNLLRGNHGPNNPN